MMTRRWWAAAVLLIALSGCGDEPATEPATVPVPATSPADPEPTASRSTGPDQDDGAPDGGEQDGGEQDGPAQDGGEGFAAAARRELPELLVDHRDEEILAAAQQACTGLAAGRSAGAVVAGVRTIGTDRAGARELVRLAIPAVCPEQDRRIDEF